MTTKMPVLARVDWKPLLMDLEVGKHVDLPVPINYIGAMTRWVRQTHRGRTFVSRSTATGTRVWRKT